MKLDRPTPNLRMFDEKMTREFHVDSPASRWIGEHRFDERAPLYTQDAHPGD